MKEKKGWNCDYNDIYLGTGMDGEVSDASLES